MNNTVKGCLEECRVLEIVIQSIVFGLELVLSVICTRWWEGYVTNAAQRAGRFREREVGAVGDSQAVVRPSDAPPTCVPMGGSSTEFIFLCFF